MENEHHVSPWKLLVSKWEKYYRPPGRPSKEAIRAYRKHSQIVFRAIKTRKPRVLVLGSTPELRDLMFELGAETTIADLHEEMVYGLKGIMKHKSQATERVLLGEWSEIKLPQNYFDVIVADVALANVPYARQELFLHNMQKALSPRGRFIQRMEVTPKNWKFEPADETLQRFCGLKPYDNQAFEMIIVLLHNTFDEKKHLISMKVVRKRLAPYFVQGKAHYPDKTVQRLLQDMWEFWKPMIKEWSIDRESRVAARVRRYFRIEKKIVLSDCHFAWGDSAFPMWICCHKNQ